MRHFKYLGFGFIVLLCVAAIIGMLVAIYTMLEAAIGKMVIFYILGGLCLCYIIGYSWFNNYSTNP